MFLGHSSLHYQGSILLVTFLQDLPADLLDENCDNFSKRQESVETQVPECDGASSPESQSTPATYHSWTSDVDVFGSPKKQHHLAKLQDLQIVLPYRGLNVSNKKELVFLL